MSSSIYSLKRALRKNLKSKLKTLTCEAKMREARNITAKLLGSNVFKESQKISVYLSMPSEVDTHGILEEIFKAGKQCFIPLYTESDMKMVVLRGMDDYENLPLTSWNIKQPHEDEGRETAIENGGLDVMLLPGLGFTESGHRIGRGRGYYDNYLLKHQEMIGRKPITVGLAFSEQICEDIPCTNDDVKLDHVLFPR